MKKLVCFSGGIDSAVVLAMNPEAEALAFDYGQPHLIELDYARRYCEMTDTLFHRIKVPVMPLVNDVVFAARNAVLASLACSYAQANGFEWIGFGCNRSDWLRFPDCRPDFWHQLRLGFKQAYQVTLATPLLYMSKQEVVEEARRLAVDTDNTWSCYSPRNDLPCDECLACHVRKEALK